MYSTYMPSSQEAPIYASIHSMRGSNGGHTRHYPPRHSSSGILVSAIHAQVAYTIYRLSTRPKGRSFYYLGSRVRPTNYLRYPLPVDLETPGALEYHSFCMMWRALKAEEVGIPRSLIFRSLQEHHGAALLGPVEHIDTSFSCV